MVNFQTNSLTDHAGRPLSAQSTSDAPFIQAHCAFSLSSPCLYTALPCRAVFTQSHQKLSRGRKRCDMPPSRGIRPHRVQGLGAAGPLQLGPAMCVPSQATIVSEQGMAAGWGSAEHCATAPRVVLEHKHLKLYSDIAWRVRALPQFTWRHARAPCSILSITLHMGS